MGSDKMILRHVYDKPNDELERMLEEVMVSIKYNFSAFWGRLNKIMFRIQGSLLGYEPAIPECDALPSMTGRGRRENPFRQPR
jgi:hypothetical protein